MNKFNWVVAKGWERVGVPIACTRFAHRLRVCGDSKCIHIVTDTTDAVFAGNRGYEGNSGDWSRKADSLDTLIKTRYCWQV